MPDGFGAEPQELLRAATVITDTLDQVAGLKWEGPSGDYGHEGVHTGWGESIDAAKAAVDELTKAAKGHGESLRDTAHHYQDSDTHVADLLNDIISSAFDPTKGIAGGFPGTDANATARTSGPAGPDFTGASGSGSANTGWSGDLGEALGQRGPGELFPGSSTSDQWKTAEH